MMSVDGRVLAIVCWCLLLLPLQALALSDPSANNAAASESRTSDDYMIGPGDTLQIFVWRSPELSGTVPVRPDGKISTPLVEDMLAVGKTPAQLGRDIEAKLSVYVKLPQVNVIVTQAVSAFSQIKVIGQVQHPQGVPYRQGMRVLDALLQVGGLQPYAAGNRAKLIRMVGNKEQQIPIKLDSLLNGGDMKQNLDLRPGDVLVVPQSRF